MKKLTTSRLSQATLSGLLVMSGLLLSGVFAQQKEQDKSTKSVVVPELLVPNDPAASGEFESLQPCKAEQPGNVLGISEGLPIEERVNGFISKLKSPVPKTRACAARQLGYLESKAKSATPQLIRLFIEEANDAVSQNVEDALYQIGPSNNPASQETLDLLKDPDILVRAYAAFTLGYYKPISREKEIALALADITKDSVPRVGYLAVKGLSRLGPLARPAVPALTAILRDKSSPLKRITVIALGSIGPSALSAVPELLEILYSTDDYATHLFVSKTLARIGPAILPLMESEFKAHPFQVLAVVENMAPEGLPLVLAALNTKDSAVRKEAMKVLERFGPAGKPAVPMLITTLQDRSATIRASTADVLAAIGPSAKEAVPALTSALADRDKIVQCSAAQALGAIGPDAKSAAPKLRRLMMEPKRRGSETPFCAATALMTMSKETSAMVPPEIARRVEEAYKTTVRPTWDDPTKPKPKPQEKPRTSY